MSSHAELESWTFSDTLGATCTHNSGEAGTERTTRADLLASLLAVLGLLQGRQARCLLAAFATLPTRRR